MKVRIEYSRLDNFVEVEIPESIMKQSYQYDIHDLLQEYIPQGATVEGWEVWGESENYCDKPIDVFNYKRFEGYIPRWFDKDGMLN